MAFPSSHHMNGLETRWPIDSVDNAEGHRVAGGRVLHTELVVWHRAVELDTTAALHRAAASHKVVLRITHVNIRINAL